MNIKDLGNDYKIVSAPNPTNIKDLGNDYSVVTPPSQAKPKTDFLQTAANVVNSIFPGKQVGQAIGTAAGAIGTKIGDLAHGTHNYDNYDLSAPSPLQVTGDIAQGALTVAAPNIGSGGTALGRIAANAALGTGLGAASGVAEGNSLIDTSKSAAVGGLVSGGASVVGEGLNYLAKNLPTWFAKAALPKLKDASTYTAKGVTPETAAEYVLNNTKGLTTNQMYATSNANRAAYEKTIQSILNHPEYANESGNATEIVQDVLGEYPSSNLDAKKVVNIVKKIAPRNSTVVDRVANGTATLSEQNTLRRELDAATKKVFTDHPQVTFNKEVASKFANSLRSNVQNTAKETAPVFAKYAREINLNNALKAAVNKKTVAGDLLAGGTGFAGGLVKDGLMGGIKGAAEAILLERAARSPAVRILAGKAANSAAKVAVPAANAAFQATKAPFIRKITK